MIRGKPYTRGPVKEDLFFFRCDGEARLDILDIGRRRLRMRRRTYRANAVFGWTADVQRVTSCFPLWLPPHLKIVRPFLRLKLIQDATRRGGRCSENMGQHVGRHQSAEF